MKTKNHVEPTKIFSTFGKVLNVLPLKKFEIMKTSYLFFVSILIMALSCNPKSEEKEKADGESGRDSGAVVEQAPPVPVCKYCVDGDTHEIKMDSVFYMIKNFQKLFGSNYNCVGGTFDVDYLLKSENEWKQKFTNQPPTSVFYPCIETIANSKPNLYISTQWHSCNPSTCLESVSFKPNEISLRADAETFFRSFSNDDLNDLTAFKIAIARRLPVGKSKLDQQVQTNFNNFNQSELFLLHPSPAMVYKRDVSILEISQFEGREKQTVSGIRYFFGLDFKNSEHILRVILCGVDKEGKLVVPLNSAGIEDWDHTFRESSRPRRP
jgi:hypothetical protein